MRASNFARGKASRLVWGTIHEACVVGRFRSARALHVAPLFADNSAGAKPFAESTGGDGQFPGTQPAKYAGNSAGNPG